MHPMLISALLGRSLALGMLGASVLAQTSTTTGQVRRYAIVALIVLGTAAISSGIVLAQSDTTPPTLNAFSFTPSVVDVSAGSAAVTVTFDIADDLSGLDLGAAIFVSPPGQQAQLQATTFSGTLVSGTLNDGTYEDILTVPIFSESGIWVVDRVFLRDQVGNTVTIPTTELTQAGFPTSLTAALAPADVTPPTLKAFSFTPTVVDVSGGPAAVTVTFDIGDAQSGLDLGAAIFVSPSGQQAQLQATAVSGTLISGTLNDGTYEDILTVPIFSESGIWVVDRVFLRDQVGNTVTIPTTELTQAGFPTELTVAPAPADVTPPALKAFSFTPSVVDVSAGSAAVTVAFDIVDSPSGLDLGAAIFVSPSGQQAQLQATAVSGTLISGTLNDGTYEDILTVPIFSESGIWVVDRVFLRDQVGNTVTIPTTELTQAGFPTELTVERNAPPTADAGGPYTVNEGGSVVVTGSGSDPDGDPITFAWDLDDHGTFETPGQSVTFSAAGLDGPTTQTVVLRVCDTSNACTTSNATVNIANVAPTVGAITAPVDPVEVGTQINAGANFTDPGLPDTHDAVWTWGDSSSSGCPPDSPECTVDQLNDSVDGTHTYTDPGVYTITLTVTDDDGGSDRSIFQFVVVFDPEGGFVTGGGWIDSPLGAYTPVPSLTGKANFGFVSKYQRGATVPTGQTKFQFRVADLNFHSTEYEWLVVGGPKARFKGSGTINGSGDFGFILTANDGQINGRGGVDKFRIKIVDKSTDEVIYDNQPSDADNANATTVLGGGSIVIHTN